MITTIALFALATIAVYRVPELGLLTYVELVRFALVQALTFLLPLSLLISVVFVYGRAAADHEITTLKASGIHPYRVLLPGVLLALLIGVLLLEVENRWAPWALFQQRVIPAQQGGLKVLLENRIANGEKMVQFGDKRSGRSIHWESVEQTDRGVVLEHVLLEQREEPDPADPHPPEAVLIRAERAIASFDERQRCIVLRLVKPEMLSGPGKEAMADGIALTFSVDIGSSRARLKFQTGPELFALEARGRESVQLGGRRLSLLRKFELADVLGSIHERFAKAATPLIFLLLGVPLALVFRSGNRLVAFLLASFIAMFVYYPTVQLAEVLMKEGVVHPILACWSGNLLLGLLGSGLLLFVVRR